MFHCGLVISRECEEGVPPTVEGGHHRVRDVGVLEAKRVSDLVESCLQQVGALPPHETSYGEIKLSQF